MPLFHKGQRLLSMCFRRANRSQRALADTMQVRRELHEKINHLVDQFHATERLIAEQQLHDIEVTKDTIFNQRRQQVILLRQCLDIRIEYATLMEQVNNIEETLTELRQQLAILKRKEIKFSQWTQQEKMNYTAHQESVSEVDTQDNIPWK